jgi:Zn-dependent protease with chaperone function
MIAPLKARWNATYYDGRRAKRHEVKVRLQQDGLLIERESLLPEFWPFEEIEQTQGSYDGEHVRLERGEGITEALVIERDSFLTAVRQIAPQSGTRFHRLEGRTHRWKWIVAAAVAAIVLSSVMYFWGVPALASLMARFVPVSWEERLGRSVASMLEVEEMRKGDSAGASGVDQIVEKLLQAEPENPYTFEVTVVCDDMVNALALPGGRILLFDGLVQIADTPDQLAGVIAHEIQHVLKRHTTRALFQEMSGQALLSVLVGETTATPFALEGVAALADLHHQRSHEVEADREGMLLLQRAEADPRGMVDMFKNMSEEDLDLPRSIQYLSSHPQTEDRIRDLEQLAAQAEHTPAPLLTEEEWSALQKACKAPSK